MEKDKSPEEVAHCARMAATMEVSAEKPGNVTPTQGFKELEYADFLMAAKELEPFVKRAAMEGENSEVGRLVYEATYSEKNINFGIIIMFIPLAATKGGPTIDLLKRLRKEDTAWIVKAMRKGKLGGMELKDEGLRKYDIFSEGIFDVIEEEEITPLKLMEMAQPYDTLAKEWVEDYPISRAIAEKVDSDPENIVNQYLWTLSRYPDTLIARKKGLEEAKKVSEMAKQVLGGSMSRQDFDTYLRSEGNSLNPGTTADLIATGLFLKLLSN